MKNVLKFIAGVLVGVIAGWAIGEAVVTGSKAWAVAYTLYESWDALFIAMMKVTIFIFGGITGFKWAYTSIKELTK